MSWEQTAVATAPVPAARLWAVLLDGRRWARWNPGIEWMLVEGELAPGSVVTTKPKGAPQTALRIEAVEPPHRLALLLSIGPLAALRLRWELSERDGATEIAQTVATSGPLAGPLLGRAALRIAGGMAANLERLAALAHAPQA